MLTVIVVFVAYLAVSAVVAMAAGRAMDSPESRAEPRTLAADAPLLLESDSEDERLEASL